MRRLIAGVVALVAATAVVTAVISVKADDATWSGASGAAGVFVCLPAHAAGTPVVAAAASQRQAEAWSTEVMRAPQRCARAGKVRDTGQPAHFRSTGASGVLVHFRSTVPAVAG